MESLVAVIVAIMLMIFAGLTMFESNVRSQQELVASWQMMEHRVDEQSRTSIEALDATTTTGGQYVEVTLRNNGTTRLVDFEDWDVFFNYESSSQVVADWYPFVELLPQSNEWEIAGIYVEAGSSTAEVIEPGIVNPGEEFVIRLRVQPAVDVDTTNHFVLTTANGAQASTLVLR